MSSDVEDGQKTNDCLQGNDGQENDDKEIEHWFEIIELEDKNESQQQKKDKSSSPVNKNDTMPACVTNLWDGVWSDLPWKCTPCLQVLNSNMQLIKHSRVEHKIYPKHVKFACPDCGFAVGRYNILLNHLRLHREKLALICDICDKKCESFANLDNHRREHRQRSLPPLMHCLTCGNAYCYQYDLRRHVRSHEMSNIRFDCSDCDKNYRTKAALMDHQLTHAPPKFACEQCGKKFTRNLNLRQHLKAHITIRSHVCNLCNKSFKTTGHLLLHNRIHKNKPFYCEECGKGFRRKYALDLHIKIHTGEKPYSCEFCQKSFRLKTTYMTHYYGHTGNKPFTCDICNREFTNRSNFNQHIRVRHGTSPTALNSEPTVKLKRKTVQGDGTLDA